ncbi:hypothetical protein [Paracoccus laeviglucosivorans]|uniref:Uncharacterized protein n=1 Tax=Paracoccus laeviglucosivorans TaxID=1197861 RepID=A0A521CXE9_9RHOB|nr:hypothetical protein [Paracoccus laeviglucosivorans]SMO64123.1 hypothetical protein SAMN06265221_105253 [Paracoccus laeviglucosivorans]
MAVVDKDNLIVFGGGTLPTGGASAGDIAAVNARIDAVLSNVGKIFPDRATAFAVGREAMLAAYGRIITIEDGGFAVRGPGQTADDPLFLEYPTWGVLLRLPGLATFLRGGIIPLAITNGNEPNWPVAAATGVFASIVGSIANQDFVSIVFSSTNTGPLNLTIGGISAASPVLSADGAALVGGEIVGGRSYILQRRGANWRIVAGDVTTRELRAAIAAEAAVRAAAVDALALIVNGISAELEGPLESVLENGTHWFGFDALRHAIMGWDASGLVTTLADRTLQNAAPRMLAQPGIEAVVQTVQGQNMRALDWDSLGRAILVWKYGERGGYDMHMSQDFWDRGAERLNIGLSLDPTYVTLTICLSQSLLFMDGDSEVAPLYPGVDTDAALMIGGLRRSDGQNLGLPGPRSMAYDYTWPGTGFVSVDPPGNIPTGAYYAVKGYNGWRRKYGLIRRRNVGMLWGQPGEHITRFNAILGDAPAPLVDSRNHWDNLMYWLNEAARIAALEGLIPSVDVLVTQGTSSKQDADPLIHARTLRQLIIDLRREFDARGFEDAMIYFTQPGGDTDTSPSIEHWHVTQSFLDLADEGYGVLVTSEAPLKTWDGNVHFSEIEGEKLLGQFNWARAAREAGRPWTIRSPKVTRNGLIVTLDYESLWDGEMWEVEPDRYNGQGIDQFHGYTCDTANITAIRLIGRKVELTFDAVPLWIDYMMQSQNMVPVNDGYTAFRGLLATTSRMRDPLNPNIVHRRRMPSHGVAVPQ